MKKNEQPKSSWFKWIVASLIALIGAGGGGVAIMQYLDAKYEKEYQQYLEAMETWENFSPSPISHGAHEVTILGGRFINLDNGQVMMSSTGTTWDLQFRTISEGSWEGMLANNNIEWAHLGVVNFDNVGYRNIRDAEFINARPGRGDKYLYYSHVTSAPIPGYTFSIKTSDGNIALVQITNYEYHPSGSRNLLLRYEVFPTVADPPRPRQP